MRPPSKPLPANQEEFERALFFACIAQSLEEKKIDDSIAEIAIKQFEAAKVTERWGSGAGFYTDYEVPRELPPIPEGRYLECMYLLEGIKPHSMTSAQKDETPLKYQSFGLGGAYFNTDGGYITFVDAHNYGEGWPEKDYRFWFFDNEASE